MEPSYALWKIWRCIYNNHQKMRTPIWTTNPFVPPFFSRMFLFFLWVATNRFGFLRMTSWNCTRRVATWCDRCGRCMGLYPGLPSGNQTLQWKIIYKWRFQSDHLLINGPFSITMFAYQRAMGMNCTLCRLMGCEYRFMGWYWIYPGVNIQKTCGKRMVVP